MALAPAATRPPSRYRDRVDRAGHRAGGKELPPASQIHVRGGFDRSAFLWAADEPRLRPETSQPASREKTRRRSLLALGSHFRSVTRGGALFPPARVSAIERDLYTRTVAEVARWERAPAARASSSTPTTRWPTRGLVSHIIVQNTTTLCPLVRRSTRVHAPLHRGEDGRHVRHLYDGASLSTSWLGIQERSPA